MFGNGAGLGENRSCILPSFPLQYVVDGSVMDTILRSYIPVVHSLSQEGFDLFGLSKGYFATGSSVVPAPKLIQRGLPVRAQKINPSSAVGDLAESSGWPSHAFSYLRNSLARHVPQPNFAYFFAGVLRIVPVFGKHVVNVGLCSPKEKMIRVNAARIITFMKHPDISREFPGMVKVAHSMRKLLFLETQIPDANQPIPLVVQLRSPLPTPFRVEALIDFIPKSMVQHKETMVEYPSKVKGVYHW